MGQILHGCARTTEAIRHAIQNSQESVKALAVRYGIKSQDRGQVEKAHYGEGCSHGTKRAGFHGFDQNRKGIDCGFPQAYLAAS